MSQSENRYLWGIDLGGTKIELVILDQGDDLKVIARNRLPTEASQGYEHILNQISKLILSTQEETNLKASLIGIGTPGALDPKTKLLKNSNTVCLNGRPVQEDLSKLSGIEFIFANDANCFAVAETVMGVVKDHIDHPQVVFGVIMGTGVGGGLVINGKVHNGLHHIGGEWGHNFLDESGGPCYCGKTGCVETIISGTGLQKYYKQISNEERKLKDIVQRARNGEDPFASQTMERLMHFFGVGISTLINILDPDAIVIGGGVGNIDELYTRGVDSIRNYIFNPTLHTRILKPKLGDSAGVFGAALLTK